MRAKIISFLLILLIVCPLVATTSSVSDLSKVGAGARILGMGKAFVGIADDCNTIFSNPAGLGKIKSLDLVSMKADLLGDINYLVLGASMPLEFGAIGVGYIGANVDGIVLTTASSSGRAVAGNSTSYSEKELFLGYGVDILKTGIVDLDGSLYLGANAKLFQKDAASAGQASGFGFDLGLLYSPSDQFSLGITQQNLGSKVNWSGASDAVESITKVGMEVQIDKVLLGMDADIAGNERPLMMHGGLEWSLIPMLALRGGFDQSLAPSVEGSSKKNNVVSNITFGLGLEWLGIKVDYAYHPYYDEAANVTHFVSLGYGGQMNGVKSPFRGIQGANPPPQYKVGKRLV